MVKSYQIKIKTIVNLFLNWSTLNILQLKCISIIHYIMWYCIQKNNTIIYYI